MWRRSGSFTLKSYRWFDLDALLSSHVDSEPESESAPDYS